MLGVSLNTLRRWSDTGTLVCYRSPGGHRRYRRGDVETLLRAQSGEGRPDGASSRLPVFAAGDGALDRLGQPLAALARVAAEGIGAASCVVALLIGERRLRVVAGYGQAEGLPPAGGVVACDDAPALSAVLRSGRRLVIADMATTSLLSRRVAENYREHGQAALLALPLVIGGRHAGVMQLADSRAPRAFTGANLAFSEFIAHQAARLVAGDELGQEEAASPDPGLAVELPATEVRPDPLQTAGEALRPVAGPPRGAPDAAKQLLDDAHVVAGLRRRNRDLTLVIEAGLDAATRQGTDEVLRPLVEQLTELSGSPVTNVYAVESDTLRALVSYDGGDFDREREDVVIPLLRYPSSRRAVETGEMVVIASLDDPLLDEEARYSLEKWGYQAQLSMPLISEGHVIGLAELSDYVPRDFGPVVELVRGLCAVAARALHNAALLEQAERRGRILHELAELGEPGDSSDLEGLLRRVADRLRAALDAATCDIFRVTADGLRCAASFDRSGYDEVPVGELLDLEKYPAVVAAMNGHRTLIITSPDDPQLTPGERQTYREYGYASEVCVPLLVDDVLYGLIDIYDTRERDYTEYLSFLKSAGQSVARVLANALLVERVEQGSRTLREIVDLGAVVSRSHDLHGALAAVAERIRVTIGAADCDIYALQGERLRCVVSADLDGFDETAAGQVLDMERFPATAMAVQSGKAMSVHRLDDPRLTAEERGSLAQYGFESEFCIPLFADDRVIGLIDVFDTRPRDYGEYADFLRVVGQMVAGAVQNALLISRLERFRERP